MRIGLNGPQDVLPLLVRRKWWAIAPFLALTCAAGLLTYILPKTYVSETLILVRPRDVPEEFVKDLIAGSPEERLKVIEQTILSRTNLIQILREFGDRLPEFQRLNMDEKVLKLRDQIKINFALEKSQGLPSTYFRILYQNQNPELAQKIASKLTTLFIEQDNRVRESQVFGTTEFLSSELEKISGQLRESETRLKSIKSTRQFELPDQREANLRTLDRLGMDKKTNAEALDRYATIRLNLETEISQMPPTIAKTMPFVGPVAVAAKPSVNAKVEEFLKAQQEYEELSTRYTAKHPEVQAAKARLERLKQQIPAEVLSAASTEEITANDPTLVPENASSTTVPNPLYQKLVGQLQEVKTEFEIRNREKAWLESEIAKYSRRVENTPIAEQDISEASRQNEDLKKQYDDLRNKLAQARLAESLESKQKGSQFVIVDPANYPLTPAKPNKQLVFLGGVVLSLLLSIAFVIVLHIAHQRIWSQSEVEAFWGVPVLVDIPEILTDSDLAVRRRKQFVYAGYSAIGALVWSFCLYIVYHKQAFVLQQLDPVLKKLVYK